MFKYFSRALWLMLLLCGASITSAQTKRPQLLAESERAKIHFVFQDMLREAERASFGMQRFCPGPAMAGYSAAREDGRAHAIVWTENAAAIRAKGIHVNSDFGKFVSVMITPNELLSLAKTDAVQFIDAMPTSQIDDDISIPETGANLLHAGFLAGQRYTGNNAIVMIMDSGIDWRHLDFRNPTDTSRTRILSIWDQTLTAQAGENPPAGFNFGVEYTQAQINAALAGGAPLRTTDQNGHGTHVAGTAVGNGLAYAAFTGNLNNRRYVGMAPEADIIIVRCGVGRSILGTWIDGLTYAQNRAAAASKPIAINMSFGNPAGGPKDGTDAGSVAVDNFSNAPGRICIASAGNSGQDTMHIGGNLPAGGSTTIEFQVPTYRQTSGRLNDGFAFNLWFNRTDSVLAALTSPNGASFTPNNVAFQADSSDGRVAFTSSISSSTTNRVIQVQVFDSDTTRPPASGIWRLTLTNGSNPVRYDGYRSNTGAVAMRIIGGDNNQSVASTGPGVARRTITVGAYVTRWSWQAAAGNLAYNGADRTGNISTFSSLGPTRDGRIKPDISAPGQGIASAMSATAAQPAPISAETIVGNPMVGNRHFVTAGTSMSSPHVAGAVALMLSANPTLTWEQARAILQQTATVDAFTGSVVPNNTWGAGKLDALEAMARVATQSSTSSQTVLGYDAATTNQVVALSGSRRLAVRFSPTTSGRLTGIQLNLTTTVSRGIVGNGSVQCEVLSSASGAPGARIGNAVSQPFSLMSTGTNNFIDMTAARANVVAGTDYFVQVSVPTAGDSLVVRTDDGSAPSHRSFIFVDGAWAAFNNPTSGLTGAAATANLRLRSVITTVNGISSVSRDINAQPQQYTLAQNYPNPFNPSTTIRFAIPRSEDVQLDIYNVLGQKISTLVSERLTAGNYTAQFNAASLASGVYFYRLRAGTFTESRKMMLVK